MREGPGSWVESLQDQERAEEGKTGAVSPGNGAEVQQSTEEPSFPALPWAGGACGSQANQHGALRQSYGPSQIQSPRVKTTVLRTGAQCGKSEGLKCKEVGPRQGLEAKAYLGGRARQWAMEQPRWDE